MLGVVNGQSAIKSNMLTVVKLSVIMLDVAAPLSSLQKNKGVQFMSVEKKFVSDFDEQTFGKKNLQNFCHIFARKQLNCLAMEQHIFCIFIDYRGHHRKGVAMERNQP